MNILHVITSLNIGGAENALRKLVLNQSISYPDKHVVISLGGKGSIGSELYDHGVNVYSLELFKFSNILKAFFRVRQIIKLEEIDIIQSWMYHSDLLVSLSSLFSNVKVCWNIRCSKVIIGDGIGYRTYMIMKICSFLSYWIPDKIVCVAEQAKRNHIKYGYNQKKMYVIPNGFEEVDCSDKATSGTLRSLYNIPMEAVVIGSVGRLNEYKDYPNLIKCANLLLTYYDNIYFVCVGRGLDTDSYLRSLLPETLEHRVKLLGEVKNVGHYYNFFDIFCLHSKSEGFPNVLGEAMMSGLPCVTTDVGDAALILNNSRSTVPPESPQDLAESIRRYIDDENLRIMDGKINKARIQKDYSIDEIVRHYNTMYKDLI